MEELKKYHHESSVELFIALEFLGRISFLEHILLLDIDFYESRLLGPILLKLL